MTPLYRWMLIPLLLLLAGCTSTSLTTRWNDPGYQGEPLKRVLVIALVNEEVARRALEQALVNKIAATGAEGIAGYSVMPDPSRVDERDELVAAVRQSGADSLLIARLQGVDKEERYVPPRIDWVPAAGYGYYDYYYRGHRQIYQPGYRIIDTVVRLELKAFSAQNESMVWAGNTETFNPQSVDKVVSELSEVIVADMRKSGLLK